MKRTYITTIVLIAILITVMIGTVAWFSANQEVHSKPTTLSVADAIKFDIIIPNEQKDSDPYMGQTGIQYAGLDAPYKVEYFPVNINIDTAGEQGLYLKFDIVDISITPKIDPTTMNLTAEEIRKNFTWRFVSYHQRLVLNPITGVQENEFYEKTYKNSNGFLIDEDGELLTVENNASYSFSLYFYFLGEEGYSLMQTNKSNIPEEYTFAFSDISYMLSTFLISARISISSLHKISLNSNGGSDCPPILTTGAEVITLPEPLPEDETKTFMGWYDNPQFLGSAFTNNTLLETPRANGFTLYARWI